MSNIYIRSQNKEKLYCFGIAFNALEYIPRVNHKCLRKSSTTEKTQDTVTRHMLCIVGERLETMGEYATRERCLEILDEIQQMLAGYTRLPEISMTTQQWTEMNYVPIPEIAIPQVYQMPEE